MPNARKKGKAFVGAWVDEKLHAELKEQAEMLGIPASDIMGDLLTAHVLQEADGKLNPEIGKAAEQKLDSYRAELRKAKRRKKSNGP